jgi:adenosylcobinamide-phosphate synthase
MMVLDFWLQVLFLALLLDIIFGEPPGFMHPVIWMGNLINFFVSRAPKQHRKLYGLFMVAFCAGTALLSGMVILLFGEGLIYLIIAAFFLKSTFSIRMLTVSALGIRKDLEGGNIEKVRNDLKTFVGRDTSKLNATQSVSAVIESLAESFVDGILAPLFYFLLFGLPGALVYRMINTLDSMVGYKKEPFKEIGYASAKLDDITNWVPARLSLFFVFITSIFFGNPLWAVSTCIRDHDKTASPNSGWSMAAVAGALGVRLEKVGYHVLGAKYAQPQPFHIDRAVSIIGISSLLVVAGILLMGKAPLISF